MLRCAHREDEAIDSSFRATEGSWVSPPCVQRIKPKSKRKLPRVKQSPGSGFRLSAVSPTADSLGTKWKHLPIWCGASPQTLPCISRWKRERRRSGFAPLRLLSSSTSSSVNHASLTSACVKLPDHQAGLSSMAPQSGKDSRMPSSWQGHSRTLGFVPPLPAPLTDDHGQSSVVNALSVLSLESRQSFTRSTRLIPAHLSALTGGKVVGS